MKLPGQLSAEIDKLRAAGAEVLAQRCDISQDADCVTLAKAVADRWAG